MSNMEDNIAQVYLSSCIHAKDIHRTFGVAILTGFDVSLKFTRKLFTLNSN